MHAIAQIPEPSARALGPDLLDARILIAARDGLARHRHPVLGAAVLERDGDGAGVLLNVVELGAVGVGKEQEVWTGSLGDGHGAVDGSGAVAEGAEEADLELVDDTVEVFELLFGGHVVVPLLCDRGVGLGVDLRVL